MIVELEKFMADFNTDYDFDPNKPDHVNTFNRLSKTAEFFILSIIGEAEYVATAYSDSQNEAIAFCISTWVEHWLKNGHNLTPKGTKSVQQLGYNFSITQPENPEFVPVIIKATLTRVKLFKALIGVSVSEEESELSTNSGGIDDTFWGF